MVKPKRKRYRGRGVAGPLSTPLPSTAHSRGGLQAKSPAACPDERGQPERRARRQKNQQIAENSREIAEKMQKIAKNKYFLGFFKPKSVFIAFKSKEIYEKWGYCCCTNAFTLISLFRQMFYRLE